MNDSRYSRNAQFVTPKQQEKIKKTKILFGGVGLGSLIAETALRLGFENFIFIDGDHVELSNLNRQNYTMDDINSSKVESISKRLKSINPEVKIDYHHVYLDEQNISQYIEGDPDNNTIAINALDYNNLAPFIFDRECIKYKIPIIHPGNYSWTSSAFIISDISKNLDDITKDGKPKLWDLVEEVQNDVEQRYPSIQWFWEYCYLSMKGGNDPSTQLSVGANLSAALTTRLMFKLATNQQVNYFPFVYLSDLKALDSLDYGDYLKIESQKTINK